MAKAMSNAPKKLSTNPNVSKAVLEALFMEGNSYTSDIFEKTKLVGREGRKGRETRRLPSRLGCQEGKGGVGGPREPDKVPWSPDEETTYIPVSARK
ncbi:MAG: hypothetical protein PHX87_04120 [Candidatus Peribacteraceae bacterium]|nr:hypothetical protein [Candidatus Peribacteraceae bacterium]MDD5742588.1 hypothetical protein [Candidatus Peribacteraceae bacterium]